MTIMPPITGTLATSLSAQTISVNTKLWRNEVLSFRNKPKALFMDWEMNLFSQSFEPAFLGTTIEWDTQTKMLYFMTDKGIWRVPCSTKKELETIIRSSEIDKETGLSNTFRDVSLSFGFNRKDYKPNRKMYNAISMPIFASDSDWNHLISLFQKNNTWKERFYTLKVIYP